MAMDKAVLKVGSVNFADSTVQTLSLPRGKVYREIWLWLTATPTVTGANNVAANIQRAELWSLIKDIQIIVNGNNTIRRFSGDQLMMLNYFMTGGVPPVREAAVGDGATANVPMTRVLRIPFWMPYTRQPERTFLDARRLLSLDLRIQWGTFTDINSAASAWTVQPVLTVYHEYVLPENPRAALGPFWTWQQVFTQAVIAGAVNNNQIKLPVGSLQRGIMLNTQNAAGTTDTTGLMSLFRWKSGAESFAELDEEVLRESFWYQRAIETFPLAVISKSSKFNLNAWYYYDRANSGQWDEFLETLGFVDNNMVLDFTGASVLNYMLDEVIPVRGASATAGVQTGAA